MGHITFQLFTHLIRGGLPVTPVQVCHNPLKAQIVAAHVAVTIFMAEGNLFGYTPKQDFLLFCR
ncbi:MAG: hypothetical protein DDT34_02561 [Firmicutes bacterium]|nr:hypothetical protein [Bacillota bacterium]